VALHICVVVCTCDRHALLGELLAALIPQMMAERGCLVVTDNGRQAAQTIVEAHRNSVATTYLRIAERGLVAARNAGLSAALSTEADVIAFIDDDETPDERWLANLAACLQRTPADIVCGPLEPKFAKTPPDWALHGPFFRKSGTAIGTGNIMFRASIIPNDPSQWFQPAFAFIGGEDEEFFQRLIAQGARFATAPDALVHECVPPIRMRLRYVLSTGFRDGVIETALHRQNAGSATAKAFARHSARKLAYAANHLFWSWKQPWRAVAALRDASEAVGTLMSAAGISGRFYGPR
jgi:succinoglycan biosynthesis protein ExoM